MDALVGLIVGGQYGEFEDLNRDGVIDNADLDIMILDIIHTVYGDANLNGSVDISDVSIWNSSKFVQATRWSQADFNADGVIDVTDFNIWQAHKFRVSAYINTEVITHQFGFTGRMFDTATGLQNNLNRWYDPAVGRWISEDSIGFAAGHSNLYRCVGNGPTNFIDPNGLASSYPDHVDSNGINWRYDPIKDQYKPVEGPATLDELEDLVGDKPGGKEFVDGLREVKEEIDDRGGIIRRRWLEQKGVLCDEADEMVEDSLSDNKDWSYKHQEQATWRMDHNWGVVYGPDGTVVTVDLWGDEIYGDGEHPVSLGNENPHGFENDPPSDEVYSLPPSPDVPRRNDDK